MATVATSRSIPSKSIDRFWIKVQKNDGCWLWTSNVTRGYGQFSFLGRPVYAHRFAWELTHGPIPEGLRVCHHCDTPLCVRPEHLFLGTQQENLADARRKGRLDESLPRGLSWDAYRDIVLTTQRGVDLARKWGITEVTVSRIRSGSQGRKTVARVLEDAAREQAQVEEAI